MKKNKAYKAIKSTVDSIIKDSKVKKNIMKDAFNKIDQGKTKKDIEKEFNQKSLYRKYALQRLDQLKRRKQYQKELKVIAKKRMKLYADPFSSSAFSIPIKNKRKKK